MVGKAKTKKEAYCVETAEGKHSERVTIVESFELSNLPHSPNVCIIECMKNGFPGAGT